MSDLVEIDLASRIAGPQRALFSDCRLVAPPGVIDDIAVRSAPVPGPRKGYVIRVTNPDFRGKLDFLFGPGGGEVVIESAGRINARFRMWRRCSVHIAAGTTITDARIVCDHADIAVGPDNLWSDEIIVQSNDQHGIVDLETRRLVNGGRRRIEIGEHVWIGRRALIMPDVRIGRGALLAAGAVLTGDMDETSIYAGVPARKIRDKVSWSRSPGGFSAEESRLFPGE